MYRHFTKGENFFMKYTKIGKTFASPRLLELVIGSSISSIICLAVMFLYSNSLSALRAEDTITNLERIKAAACELTVKLDKMNLSYGEMKVKGYAVINYENIWYLVCNLRDVKAEKNINPKDLLKEYKKHKDELGLMFVSNSEFDAMHNNHEEHSEEDKYIAVFLRFSSAKQKFVKPSDSNENFANLLYLYD